MALDQAGGAADRAGREYAGEQGAGQATSAVDTEHVERVIIVKPVFQPGAGRSSRSTTGPRPSRRARDRTATDFRCHSSCAAQQSRQVVSPSIEIASHAVVSLPGTIEEDRV